MSCVANGIEVFDCVGMCVDAFFFFSLSDWRRNGLGYRMDCRPILFPNPERVLVQ